MQAGTLSRPNEARLLEAFEDELTSHKMIGAILQDYPPTIGIQLSQAYNIENKLELVKNNFDRSELVKILELYRTTRDELRSCQNVQKLMYDVLKSSFEVRFAPYWRWV